jgi:putative PIN family toxin of toxin-antitoxin system
MTVSLVPDTNVLIAALRSRQGASFRLLSLLGSDQLELNVSVPLVFEYEDVAKRHAPGLGRTPEDIDVVLDYLCAIAQRRRIYFLWRPVLRDPRDDMVLELAVEAVCDCIVTHNLRDFAGAERFGVQVVRPGAFLRRIGVAP